jgi:pimeloyl-ACP methyl ester carboxylesterase
VLLPVDRSACPQQVGWIEQRSSCMVRQRHVFHLAGYDPIGAAWYRQFKRELAIFARTWSICSAVSEFTQSSASHAQWKVTTRALNWQVETIYELLLWDDIVLADFGQPMTKRLAKSSFAFFDIVMTGTAFHYLRANWQYALFFLFPFFLLSVFAVIAVAMANWVASSMTLPHIPHVAVLVALSVSIFALLLHWPGRRWRVQQGLDDWIFSWDYLYGRRPDITARLDHFAERLVARARNTALDEIIIVGHSIGATLALEVVTRALAIDPNLGRQGPAVCLLTVGSTIAKFALHPAGGSFRHHAARIVGERSIAWAEYHARSDAISFYKFDPVTLTRFYGDPISGKPLLRRVWLQQMLTTRTYWRYRLRFMRLHYQFVMANERRSTYDYFMMVCGPIPFARLVLAPTGPVELIASDGALIDPVAPIPLMPLGAADDDRALPGGPCHDTQSR